MKTGGIRGQPARRRVQRGGVPTVSRPRVGCGRTPAHAYPRRADRREAYRGDSGTCVTLLGGGLTDCPRSRDRQGHLVAAGLLVLYLQTSRFHWAPAVVYSTLGTLVLLSLYDLARFAFPTRWFETLWLYEHLVKMIGAHSSGGHGVLGDGAMGVAAVQPARSVDVLGGCHDRVCRSYPAASLESACRVRGCTGVPVSVVGPCNRRDGARPAGAALRSNVALTHLLGVERREASLIPAESLGRAVTPRLRSAGKPAPKEPLVQLGGLQPERSAPSRRLVPLLVAGVEPPPRPQGVESRRGDAQAGPARRRGPAAAVAERRGGRAVRPRPAQPAQRGPARVSWFGGHPPRWVRIQTHGRARPRRAHRATDGYSPRITYECYSRGNRRPAK